MREIYSESELGRYPTLEEILFNLQTVLAADLEGFTSNLEGLELGELVAKTRKKAAKPKPRDGNVLQIPFSDHTSGFAQVLKVLPRQAGVVGVYPLVQKGIPNLVALSEMPFVCQLRIELTGVLWRHWRIVGDLPVAASPEPAETGAYSPCQVAVWEMIDALQKVKVLDPAFRVYTQIKAYHPSRCDRYIEWLSETMRFLVDRKLLSKDGLAMGSAGRVQPDFVLHSGLLTEQGKRFYDSVFAADYAVDTQEDTYVALEQYWATFKGNP